MSVTTTNKKMNGHSITTEQDLSTIADKQLHTCEYCELSAYRIKPFFGTECDS